MYFCFSVYSSCIVNTALAAVFGFQVRHISESSSQHSTHRGRTFRLPTCRLPRFLRWPVSSEISDLCEISDLLLFVSYFASNSKGTKFGVHYL